MAKEMTAAERVAAAYVGRKKNPARQAAGKKGAAKASWKRIIGKANKTQGGNPYWGLGPAGTRPGGGIHFAGAKQGPSMKNPFKQKPRRRVMADIGKTTKPPGRFDKLLRSPEARGMGAGILISMLMNAIGGQVDQARTAETERMMMEAQAGSATPENLYYQMALPQAQAQEQALAGALLGRLSGGGVLGPSLAKGEYSIGG